MIYEGSNNSNTEIIEGDFLNPIMETKSIESLNTLLRALKENTFYAYLYSNNKCIGKYKMAVYFNRAVNEITENNRSSFKSISFRVNLTQKRIKELNKNAKYIDCFKITMFNDIYYKGVFKTLNFEKEYFCIKKEIVLKYCLEIDKF